MPDNKKKTAQDRKVIAAKQEHELDYLKEAYGVPRKVTREIIGRVGRSRKKVYAELRLLQYPVPPVRK